MLENTIITIHRRQQMALITSGLIDSISPIAMIAFGGGGTDDQGEPLYPSAVATGLNSEIARYPVSPVTFPLDPEPRTTARYSATIPADDLAGALISEAGLVDADGVFCAIQTMFVKRKDRGVEFTFTFDDEF